MKRIRGRRPGVGAAVVPVGHRRRRYHAHGRSRRGASRESMCRAVGRAAGWGSFIQPSKRPSVEPLPKNDTRELFYALQRHGNHTRERGVTFPYPAMAGAASDRSDDSREAPRNALVFKHNVATTRPGRRSAQRGMARLAGGRQVCSLVRRGASTRPPLPPWCARDSRFDDHCGLGTRWDSNVRDRH